MSSARIMTMLGLDGAASCAATARNSASRVVFMWIQQRPEGGGSADSSGYLKDLKVALFFAHHALQVSDEPLDSCVISLSALLSSGISSAARLPGLSSELRTVTLPPPGVGAV